MGIGVISIDPFASAIFLAAFIGGISTILYMNSAGAFSVAGRRIRKAEMSEWTLTEFLSLESRPNSKRSFLFSEQSVFSLGHRFNGRFDNAVLHWEEAPVLDAIIERKFPTRHLPEKPRDEDIFQAELYALALMESGVSCSSTKLVLVYCLQKNAKECIGRNHPNCVACGNGLVFTRRFKQKRVLRALEKLDEVWYQGRKPKANPREWRCRGCPYGRNGVCNHTAA
jgi:CRISPR/Cas system-associated exonuclease Cas4 (RecB family)